MIFRFFSGNAFRVGSGSVTRFGDFSFVLLKLIVVEIVGKSFFVLLFLTCVLQFLVFIIRSS